MRSLEWGHSEFDSLFDWVDFETEVVKVHPITTQVLIWHAMERIGKKSVVQWKL